MDITVTNLFLKLSWCIHIQGEGSAAMRVIYQTEKEVVYYAKCEEWELLTKYKREFKCYIKLEYWSGGDIFSNMENLLGEIIGTPPP